MRAALSIGVVAPLVAPLGVVQPYGNHIFLQDLARGLAGRGHRVTVYAAEGSVAPGIALQPIRVAAAARGGFLVLREHDRAQAAAMRQAFETLFAKLRRAGHDVVSQHAFDREAIEAGAGVPVLHTLHLPPMRADVVDAVARSADTFATVSATAATSWQRATGRLDLITLPNGVPPLATRPPEPRLPIAVVGGRISREKGVAEALRAARRAGLRAIVVGEIYDDDYFRREVVPELAGADLWPALPRDAFRRLLERASVLLMPIAWDEPFGLVAAEAQLAGCPVAGYRRGALPEVVAEPRGGCLAEPGDEDALASAIRSALLLDGSAVRAQAQERLSMAACLDGYESVLRHIAATACA